MPTVRPNLADLPPVVAKTCLAVERFCLRQAQTFGQNLRGSGIVVAFSGGPDSLALLLLLATLADRLALRLHAAHVDHCLRPESADEAAYAASLCERLGIPFRCQSAQVAKQAHLRGQGLEEAGREVRYAFFEDQRRKLGFDLIATGHTADDLATDQLLRLCRGSGWPALGGMPALDPARKLIRPLLMTPRAALWPLIGHHGLTPVQDASNADPCFARNRMRQELLPLILRENPNYLSQVCALWRQSQSGGEQLEAQVCDALVPKGNDEIFVERQALLGSSPQVRQAIVLEALRRLGGTQGARTGIPAVLDCLQAGQFPKSVSFSKVKASINGQGVSFRKKHPGER